MCICTGFSTCFCSFWGAGGHRGAAKFFYATLFLITAVLAWIVRDYSEGALSNLSYFKGCQEGHNCLGAEGILRVTLGLFLFFAIMFVTTVGTKTLEDFRDRWHIGWWPLKLLLWLLLLFLPFFIPSGFFHVYAEIARIGAGLFLIIQILSIINFVYIWSEAWKKNYEKWKYLMILITIACYGLALAGTILMFIFFVPRASCGLNIFFIIFTLCLIIVFTTLPLLYEVDANLFTSALMTAYVIFLCYSAIMNEPVRKNEPPKDTCNLRSRQSGHGDWVTIISFLLAFFAIIIAAFTTSVDSRCLDTSNRKPAHGEVPYGYGFFHLVFAMGSMYLSMLFIGWDLTQTQAKWSMDSGWISVWVKISSEWISAIIYLWTIVAPLIFKGHDFSHDDHMDLVL